MSGYQGMANLPTSSWLVTCQCSQINSRLDGRRARPGLQMAEWGGHTPDPSPGWRNPLLPAAAAIWWAAGCQPPGAAGCWRSSHDGRNFAIAKIAIHWRFLKNYPEPNISCSECFKNVLGVEYIHRARGKEFWSHSTIRGIKLWQVLSWPAANPGYSARPRMAIEGTQGSWCRLSACSWRRRSWRRRGG